VSGTVLHPESNRAEWAIVALACPVQHHGTTFGMLCLRPRVTGRAVGDPPAVPVHVALVSGVTETEAGPRYRVGELVGTAVCEPEPEPAPPRVP
jgi:hypothetical protein